MAPAETESFGPYFSTKEMPSDFAPFAFLKENFGFVPHVFRAQTLYPAAVVAEVPYMRRFLVYWVFRRRNLTRLRKIIGKLSCRKSSMRCSISL